MTDLEKRIFDIAKDLQLLNFATASDGGKPSVRYVVGRADATLTLRFSTHLDSNKVSQLRNNPNVCLTLGANSVRSQSWLRVDGTAEVSTEDDERRTFWFDGLERYFAGVDDPRYCIVIVKPATIELGSMSAPPEVWRSH